VRRPPGKEDEDVRRLRERWADIAKETARDARVLELARDDPTVTASEMRELMDEHRRLMAERANEKRAILHELRYRFPGAADPKWTTTAMGDEVPVEARASHGRRRGHRRGDGDKVHRVLREFKEGKLHSGSKEGPVVTDRKQAVAIALAEAKRRK
jgi:hypothetical protein